MAEVGFIEIVLRPLAEFCRRLPSLSDSASSPRSRLAAIRVALPSVADCATTMALDMALDVTNSDDIFATLLWEASRGFDGPTARHCLV